ncbi:MAG: hypothetical protein VW577_05370 [Pelagibacteraceae bacterium]
MTQFTFVPEVENQSLIAGPIMAYLEQEQKTPNPDILTSMTAAFQKTVTRQLMQPRDTRAGYESATSYTGSCARKSRLQFDGETGERLLARPRLKFLMGDILELSVIGLAQLAGVMLRWNNRELWITGRDGVEVVCHPDGLVTVGDQHWNVEVKSADTKTYDHWVANGGPDDTWGYLTQASVECAAWRQAGVEVQGTCFVAVSTGSRQGSITEWIVPANRELIEAWHDRRGIARGPEVPDIPFSAAPERSFLRSKTIDPSWLFHGDPVPRMDKNGSIYGYDVPTGRKIVPMICSYCTYRSTQCWTTAIQDMDGTKPIWVVPS